MLIGTLQARRIAVGANFRFGRGREGGAETLKAMAEAAGVRVTVVPILEDPGGRMSNSRIRQAWARVTSSAHASCSARLISSREPWFRAVAWAISSAGPPPIFRWMDASSFLDWGCTAWAWVEGEDAALPAVMNLGPQPTVDPDSPSAVEVHLLDTRRELVGRTLGVEPVERLRGQCRFDLEELGAQISRDAQQARERLQRQRDRRWTTPDDENADAAQQDDSHTSTCIVLSDPPFSIADPGMRFCPECHGTDLSPQH